MTDDDSLDLTAIVARLRRIGLESSRIEVKSAVGGLPKSTAETLSAFANGDGGLLILGLDESSGFIRAEGFDPLRIRDALAGMCSDALEPPIRTELDIKEFEGGQVVVLEVPPVDPLQRPCFVKARGHYGGSYIRSGDGDRRLSQYEITQLLSNRRQPRDDEAVVQEATLDDLDSHQVAALLARLRERQPRAFADLPDDLALVRAGAAALDHHEVIRPTLAGLLCLGIYPQTFFPQLFVSVVVLPGIALGDSMPDGTRFLDNATCDGPISEMLALAISVLRRNMRTAVVIGEQGRQDRSEYPSEVLRELIVNALLHRDYSELSHGTQIQVELYPNRLVVKSPGGLYGDVALSQLGVEHVSSTRNATLARLLSDVADNRGFPVCENRGSGIPRVMTQLRSAGMAPAQFHVSPGHVHVTVPQQALLTPDVVSWIVDLGEDLTGAQQIALALARLQGSVSNEMLRAWGSTAHEATTALRGLVDRGLLVKFGSRRDATYELASKEPGAAAARASGRGHSRRVEAELRAVMEAVRAGDVTSLAISERLGISRAASRRRINTLIDEGRLKATGPATSPNRAYEIADPSDGRS